MTNAHREKSSYRKSIDGNFPYFHIRAEWTTSGSQLVPDIDITPKKDYRGESVARNGKVTHSDDVIRVVMTESILN